MCNRASQVVLVATNLLASVGDVKRPGLMLGLGRSPGARHGKPLQYSCLENPMDRGDRWATVHGVTGSNTTERLTTQHTDVQQFYFKELRAAFLETECRSEQEVPDPFLMKFERTQGSSHFAKSGARARCEYLPVPKGKPRASSSTESKSVLQ